MNWKLLYSNRVDIGVILGLKAISDHVLDDFGGPGSASGLAFRNFWV